MTDKIFNLGKKFKTMISRGDIRKTRNILIILIFLVTLFWGFDWHVSAEDALVDGESSFGALDSTSSLLATMPSGPFQGAAHIHQDNPAALLGRRTAGADR